MQPQLNPTPSRPASEPLLIKLSGSSLTPPPSRLPDLVNCPELGIMTRLVGAPQRGELLDHKVPTAEACWRCATGVAVPPLAANLTIIASFLPLLLLSGACGEFIRAFPSRLQLPCYGSRCAQYRTSFRQKRTAGNANAVWRKCSSSDRLVWCGCSRNREILRRPGVTYVLLPTCI